GALVVHGGDLRPRGVLGRGGAAEARADRVRRAGRRVGAGEVDRDGGRCGPVGVGGGRDVVNKHGGDVTVTHLPEVGIKGNTHFPFSDLNNVQIADLVSQFLKEKNLQ
ncbi:hypothetical protein ACFW5E_23665, partial [Klebsiella aerogenes]